MLVACHARADELAADEYGGSGIAGIAATPTAEGDTVKSVVVDGVSAEG